MPAWPRTFKRPQVRHVGATWTTVISTTDERERRNTITVLRWRAGPPRAIQPRFVRAREIRAGSSELCEDDAEVPLLEFPGDDAAFPAPVGEEDEAGEDGVDVAGPPVAVEPAEVGVDVDGAAGVVGVGRVGVVVGTEGVCGTVVVVGSVTGRLGTLIVVVGRSMPGASAASAA